MEKIKDASPAEKLGEQNIICALQLLRDSGEEHKVYVIHLLHSGLDIYINEETYLMMTGKNREYYTPEERQNMEMSCIEGCFIKNIICGGQFYEEFVVNNYGIEYIKKVKH